MSEEEIYKNLQPDRILETITRLGKRIRERFPDSSLATLCEELRVVSEKAKERSERIRRPIVALRLTTALLVVVIIAGVVATLVSLKTSNTGLSLVEGIQLFEAGINDVVLIGAGIFFLVTLETRIKRNRALEALHELRSFAHIIDMHQLTKDMSRSTQTASSPKRQMAPDQLERYLDYCSEMLSLVGKVAALYIQHFNEAVAIAAVTEVENLTTSLSRKIWQKITLIESHLTREPTADPEGPTADPEEPEPDPEEPEEPMPQAPDESIDPVDGKEEK